MLNAATAASGGFIFGQNIKVRTGNTDYGVSGDLLLRAWPGNRFTDPPVSLPAAFVGIGQAGQMHAPDKWYLIDAKDPKLAGINRQALFYAEFLCALAKTKP